ncbi:MAG: nucleotidyltransferase domain-containing protein [Treponema sp.]|jgi:predicted nucleotidyltransferase|nr:nucleotidyltransferase domain-containing protein [Treponema sp.]
MAVNYEAVYRAVESYVADVKATIPIDKVYLFGSYAKGTANEYSDVDICFFSKNFEDTENEAIFLKLHDFTLKYAREAVYIEPHTFATYHLYNDNPFVKEVLRTGREIL